MILNGLKRNILEPFKLPINGMKITNLSVESYMNSGNTVMTFTPNEI